MKKSPRKLPLHLMLNPKHQLVSGGHAALPKGKSVMPSDTHSRELTRLAWKPTRVVPVHVKGYGWTPSLRHVDSVPFDFDMFGVVKPKRLPRSVDLRAGCPPVYDQAKLGSCTANVITAALEFDLKRQGGRPFMPSRLYIYWNERHQLGVVGQDAGASIHLSAEVVREFGACHEADWPYVPAKFAEVPSRKAFESADGLRLKEAYFLENQDLNALKGALASGVPFVFGISVYQSFESPIVMHTGLVPLPVRGEASIGGHAMMAVGYDDVSRLFLVRNSWSAKWGIEGYCWIPYDYLTSPDLAADFWAIQVVVSK